MWVRPLRVETGSGELTGDLSLPDVAGPHAGVVLLHGASWGERKFYAAFAEAFVEAGVATLAFDRRGEGQSTGERSMDLFALAQDALAAAGHLRKQAGIDPVRTGYWGYSNGAWVATLAAADDPDCAFVILAGASGVSPAAAEVFRRTEDLRTQGVAARTLEAVQTVWTILFDYMTTGDWDPAWDAELSFLTATIEGDAALMALPVPAFVQANPQLDSVPRIALRPPDQIRSLLHPPRPYLGFDPIPLLERLRCPLLVVLAENDANLPVATSLPRFEGLASRAGTDVTVLVVPGTDHYLGQVPLSERTDSGLLTRPRARADFLPGYLELMANWVADRT